MRAAHVTLKTVILCACLLAQPGAARVRASRPSLAGLGPRAGHCGYVRGAAAGKARRTATDQVRLQSAPGGKATGALPAGAEVKILEVKGEWLKVGKVDKGCFSDKAPLSAGWLRQRSLTPFYLLATERRADPVPLNKGPLYRFDRQQMILQAFGQRSPTLDDEGGQGYRVWTTGDRRLPFLFHTLAWDMGPGSLTLFGPGKLVSLTSPGTRFTVRVAGGAFRLDTDHLCLQLGLALDLPQLVKRKAWPGRFDVLQIRVRGAARGETRLLELDAATLKREQLPVVGIALQARDARRPAQQVPVARGTSFRPRAVIMERRDGEEDATPLLEVELLPGKRRVLLDQDQVAKTTLMVHCAG